MEPSLRAEHDPFHQHLCIIVTKLQAIQNGWQETFRTQDHARQAALRHQEDALLCLEGGSGTAGQGQFLTRILAPYPVKLDLATYVSLNKLFGHTYP
jgi:hypothetical protein